MTDELKSSRTELNRLPARGHYDFETIAAILDEAFVCHVGFVTNGQPYVIPTIYGREGELLYLHGAAAGRLLNATAAAAAICVTVTLVDGLVLARSGFHSSINYRSVVMLGSAEPVEADQKDRAMKVISDHVLSGRWEEMRPVTEMELEQTSVLQMDIIEASAKIRSGPPIDDEQDYALPIWAGTLDFQPPSTIAQPDDRLHPDAQSPEYAKNYRRPRRG
jgi:nitroimidazol reductase NimA-like FMN-containing flavoprotein (pyridoxamine 5'-phosphate oxidase superfamily)